MKQPERNVEKPKPAKRQDEGKQPKEKPYRPLVLIRHHGANVNVAGRRRYGIS